LVIKKKSIMMHGNMNVKFYSWQRRDRLASLLWKAITHHFLHQPS